MTRPPNRVVLALCGYGPVPFEFAEEWHRLRSASAGYVTARGLYVEHNRNQLVNQALGSPYWDYLLFVDPDMTFPRDLMDRVQGYEAPVVSGLYWRRSRPEPVAGTFRDENPTYDPITPEELLPWMESPGLYPVEGVGAGCLAVRRDVFEEWPDEHRPIFQTISTPDGSEMVGEDVYFCWRLKQRGVPVLLDTNVCCGHIASLVVDRDVYLANYEERA